jgi:diaminopimelate epimerase
MKIPFAKSHGARNDFLLTWRSQLPPNVAATPELARAICDRNSGVGADGWILLDAVETEADAAIELWNSDGSRSEISGNGTRCAAAWLLYEGVARGENVVIATGAGPKALDVKTRDGARFLFEMNMGAARIEQLNPDLVPGFEAVILNVGNPQLAVFCSDFEFDWRSLGAALERHPYFPNRTNVSFIRVLDDHTLDVRFFERGAGETMSSGTGSTGAVAAAVARQLVSSPVRVKTPAGDLHVRCLGADYLLTGPAEITVTGEFFL